jgi:uncharacterized membrane protein YczE
LAQNRVISVKSLGYIWVRKIFIYGLGLFILALGIAFSVKSDLGVSPVSSVPFVVARITGLSLGTTTALIYILNMAVQAAVQRRRYKLINLFQFAISFLFGYFTDTALWLTSFLPTGSYVARFVYMLFGIALIAFGVMFYLTASLIALPTDGTVQAIASTGKLRLYKVKIGYDCVSAALAIALSLAVLHDFQGIGIGTIAASFGVGKMLGVFSRLFKKRLLCFIDSRTAEKVVRAGRRPFSGTRKRRAERERKCSSAAVV